MAKTTPSYMFEHELRPAKGWFQPAALDYAAKVSPNVTIDIDAGRVVHLNANGEFEMGISSTDMAIFTLGSDYDFDVTNPGTTGSGLFMHQTVMPNGTLNGLVATGAYELHTTEFDKAPTTPYAPNQLLTALADNTDANTGGVLSNDRAGAGGAAGPVRQYIDPACGVVSSGQYQNEHGVSMLAFWPVYLPAQFV